MHSCNDIIELEAVKTGSLILHTTSAAPLVSLYRFKVVKPSGKTVLFYQRDRAGGGNEPKKHWHR